jgi:hypothetical protein
MVKKIEKKKEEKYVMVCPRCKSPDVEMDRTNPVQPAMGLPPMYICNKCGHSGNTFPEVLVSDLDEFEDEVKKEGLSNLSPDKTPKVDTRYGSFEVKVLWKITAPITLLAGIFLLFKEPISGSILTLLGLLMFYITYFKKRKLSED